MLTNDWILFVDIDMNLQPCVWENLIFGGCPEMFI
jgi:hypothetical protein